MRDVSRLRDYIENTSTNTVERDVTEEVDDDDFEVLRDSPEIADGKFKLEIGAWHAYLAHSSLTYALTAHIAKTNTNDDEETANPATPTQAQTLSIYITSLTVGLAHTDYEMSTSMFAAIKSQDDRAGERGARAHWAWEYWQDSWVFRQGSEVWGTSRDANFLLLV